MGQNRLDYEQLCADALRGVVRRALALVADKGLPGGHHFLITFKTDHPGVGMPDHLRERYPDFIVAAQLKNGTLVRILESFEPPALPIYAVYPSRRFLPAKVRAFVEYFAERCSAQA